MKQNLIHWSEGTPVVKSVASSTAPPNYVIPQKWFASLKDFDLWLICEGSVELLQPDGRKSLLSRGSTVLLAPGSLFELRVSAKSVYTNSYLHFDLLDKRGRLLPHHKVQMPPVIGFAHDIHFFESTMRRIMFLQYQAKHSASKAREMIAIQTSHLLKGLLYDCEFAPTVNQATSAGLGKHYEQIVSSALSWLYLRPESITSAADLAKNFGYSQRHFCRIFHQITGKTPGQAIIEARIDQAKKLLATSALNVTEIADSLRYENVFYFSRQFKHATGMSPMEYRSMSASA